MDRRAPRIVVTGGPHSGKTALLHALMQRGCRTVPESALQVIDELNGRFGVAGQVEWRKNNRLEFQEMIAARQLALEAAVDGSDPRPVFFDRGLHDGLAYCKVSGCPVPATLASAELMGRYTHVFVLATILPFDPRAGTGRTSSEEMSRQVGDELFAIYSQYGHAPRRIPRLPAEERLAAIWRMIGD